MNLVKVVVAVLCVVVGDHLVGGTLEAHALVAASAGDTVATVNFDHRHSTVGIGAETGSVL